MDLISWNCVLDACDQGNQWPWALSCLRSMGVQRIVADTLSSNAVLGASVRSKQSGAKGNLAAAMLQSTRGFALHLTRNGVVPGSNTRCMVPDSREVRLDPLLLRTEEHAENTPSEAPSR
eukprot:s4150_g4.t1